MTTVLPKTHINGLISRGDKTKTFNFMFLIELSLYYSEVVSNAYESLEITGIDDCIDAYVQDEAYDYYNHEKEAKKLYFIKVRDNTDEFKKAIKIIKRECPFYVSHYKAGSVDSDYTVIVTKVIVNKRFNLMTESKYSEMFTEKELNALFNNITILRRYRYYPNLFRIDKEGFEDEMGNVNIIINALYHSAGLRKMIESYFGLPEKSTIANEYYSNFEIKSEIFNSNVC